MPASRSLNVIFLLAIELCLTVAAVSQKTQANNTTGTPAPSSGHDYIQMLDETVNPANGSLSIRTDIPVPKGRGLSLPFGFAYDSNGVWHLDSFDDGGTVWLSNTSFLGQGGWSYSAPLLSYAFLSQPNCSFTSEFIFQDPSGGSHALGLSAPGSGCTMGSISFSGDDFFRATGGAFGGPTSVADTNGTVYYFAGTQLHSGYSPVETQLPTYVEDRNGNRITITDYMTSTGETGPNRGVFTYTDTLGHTVLSSSGFGSSGNTVSISGQSGSYSLGWGTAGSSYSAGFVQQGTQCNPPPAINGTQSVITAITLPNSLVYQFFYDSTYGTVNKIVYPTGGYVRYEWGLNSQSDGGVWQTTDQFGNPAECWFHYGTAAVMHRYVSFDGSTEVLRQDFGYSTTWPSGNTVNWSSKQTTVTTWDLVRGTHFETDYTYLPSGCGGPDPPNVEHNFAEQCPVEQTAVYKNWDSSTLRTESKTWLDVNMLATDQVVLETGQTSKTTYTYANNNTTALVTEKDEYDYGQGVPGPLLRKTITNYASFPATTIFAAGPYIFDLPCQIITKNGADTRFAEQDFLYDGGTTVCGSPGSASTSTVGNLNSGSIITHDESNYSSGSTTPRGNPTTVTLQCFLPPGGQNCPQASLTAAYSYDETGQVVSKTDPAGNQTQYSYTDSYTDATPPVNTNAYATTITYASTGGVQHVEHFSYAYSDGKLTVATDQNGKQTSYTYADSLRRLTQVDYPDGGRTSYDYHSDTLPITVTETRLATPDPSVLTSTVYDGLGKAIHTRIDSDPDGDISTDRTYDGLSRLFTQTNPHRTVTVSTDGTTQYAYDAEGRTTSIIRPDNTVVSDSYSGNCVTVTDEALHPRKSCSDALARLTTVVEPNPSTGLLTAGAYFTYYGYDPLDNLLSVNQQGDGSLSARNRNLSYDSLSRLVSASNPESGTVNYTYDLAADCPSPNSFAGDLVKRSDGRNVRTCYRYDALHRLVNKNYSDTTSPVTYSYDQGSYNGLNPITNGIGRRTGMSDGTGQTAWSYNEVGNVLTKRQTIAGVTNNIIHTYNKNRAVATLTSPNGHVYTYSYSGSGRTLSLIDNGNGITYAQNAHYAPPGELATASHGLNLAITERNNYNNRLQPTLLSSASSSQTLLSMSYVWAPPGGSNNGNVYQVQNNRDHTRDTQFGYDYLNRLTSAQTFNATTWGDAYIYDAFGNLLQKNPTQGIAENLQVTVDANNHVNTSGFTYDAAGNLTWDTFNALNFDAENRVNPATGWVYSYDGDDRRVEKNNAGSITYYWYDSDSNVVATTGALVRDYVYFNGKRLAYFSVSSGNPHYYWSDHLGSASVMSNNSGNTIEWESDYYPFGTKRVLNNSLENKFLFADYEFDYEMGYYYARAREQSPNLGRFMSPDPVFVSSRRISDPQQWNLYTYVRNTPTTYKDPTGLDCAYLNSAGSAYDHMSQTIGQKDCGKSAGYWIKGGLTDVQIDRNNNAVTLTGTNNGSDTTKASYEIKSAIVVSEYYNTFLNPAGHIAFGVNNGPKWGLNPKSDYQFMKYAISRRSSGHVGGGPGVPGAVKVQGGKPVATAVIPATGMQAQMVIDGILDAVNTPPNYDVGGGSQTCDCASWPQEILGNAGLNTGAQTQDPGTLINQIEGLYPQD